MNSATATSSSQRRTILCAKNDMGLGQCVWRHGGSSNEFASFLLMPLTIFERSFGTRSSNIGSFEFLRQRYAVSLTAVILKWLSITKSGQ